MAQNSTTNRLLTTNRDMAIAVLLLLLFGAAFAGLAGQCSFAPGGPDAGPVNPIDADTVLRHDARDLGFAVRKPRLEDGWVPNSHFRRNIDGSPASFTGWVRDGRQFVQLVQSGAPLRAFVDGVDERSRPRDVGEMTVNGVRWSKHTGDREGTRALWAADLGEVRVGLLTDAGDDLVRTFAVGLQAATPIAR